MKIAYFSPMPPAKTGIAAYSGHLVPALAERSEITVFSPGEYVWQPPSNCRIVDFKTEPFWLKSLPEFDRIVYHLGNNPWFHLDIYRAFLQFPGVVVLHDVLYYLIAGLGRGGLIKEFCENYGINRIQEAWDLIDSCPDGDLLRYRQPEKYPFLQRVIKQARGIIVHNRTSADVLKSLNAEADIHIIPFLYSSGKTDQMSDDNQIQDIRRRLSVGKDGVLVGIFGFIGPTKRIGQALKAIQMFKENYPEQSIRVLIVGEGDSIKNEISITGLQDSVSHLGYVPDQQFAIYMEAIDILINLRYPSMGESSFSLIEAMALGKPSIVTDHAFFSELPDDAVLKVSYGEKEIKEIFSALERLILNKNDRLCLGSAARSYLENHCAPDKVSAAFLERRISC
jgi:glycosyltransferase involved in cell wall biosynthesis